MRGTFLAHNAGEYYAQGMAHGGGGTVSWHCLIGFSHATARQRRAWDGHLYISYRALAEPLPRRPLSRMRQGVRPAYLAVASKK